MKLLLLLLIPLVVLTTACKRDQAVWETDWQAPLLKDTLTLEKLITDSYVSVNGNYLELSFDRTIFELNLSDVVEIPDTTVSHAYAFPVSGFTVPAGSSFVNNVQEHEIALGDVELKKITIKSGGIAIRLLNPIGTKAFFTVELPGVTRNGVTLSQNFVAPSGTLANPGSVNGFVDLQGYEIDLRGANAGSFNKLQSKMLVTSDPAGPTVVINSTDSLKFLFTMQDIKLDYARGYFGNQLISDTITEYIDALGKITGGIIDLPASAIELEIVNGLKVAAKAKVTGLKSTNNEGTTVNLVHPSIGSWITLNSATGNAGYFQPSSTSLLFNGQNSNVESLLENHGASNEVGFQLQLNPWGNTSGGWDEIFPQSSLKVNLSADMPLSIGLTDVVLQDTFAFSFKQDFTKTHVKSGSIWMNATNGFPLSAEVVLYLMDSQGNVITALPGSAAVLSSEYGAAVDGILQKKSTIEFFIPESALSSLESVTQLSVKVKLNTPNAGTNMSEQMQVPAGSFFGFKIGAKLKVEARI